MRGANANKPGMTKTGTWGFLDIFAGLLWRKRNMFVLGHSRSRLPDPLLGVGVGSRFTHAWDIFGYHK